MKHETSSHSGARVLLALCFAFISLGLMLFFPAPPPAHAAAMTVNTLSDSIAADGFCSLREAMTNANNNNLSGSAECTAGTVGLDTITITATGIITLSSSLPTITDTLAINGPGAALLTIKGNNTFGVMVVSTFNTLNLSNVTIANGTTGLGGGIYHIGLGTLNITNTTFYSNSALYGGGINVSNSTVNITNTTFFSNSGSLDGGALYLGASNATIANSSFYSNTIRLGTSDGGAAIYTGNSTLNITNTTFYSNSSSAKGGGIWNLGTLNIISSTFSNNRATNSGGGIYSNNGVVFPSQLVTISNSNLYSNTALHGGGMYSNGPLTITNTNFYSNSATSNGGGIYNDTGTVSITGATFFSNTATSNGGGIYATLGAMNINNTAFDRNTAIVDAGAIYNSGGNLALNSSNLLSNTATTGSSAGIRNTGTLTLTNSTLSFNRALTHGGGLRNSGAVWITNTTFYSNTATTGIGGGIMNQGTLTMTNSTLSANSTTSGGGINNNTGTVALYNTIVANNLSGGNCAGTIANGGNNIDDGLSCAWGSTDGSQSSTNPLLGPFANNGGSTQTMALLSGSPAIDGVTFNAPNGCPSTDQRGIARPIGVRCDIGAFEAPAYLRIFLPLVLR